MGPGDKGLFEVEGSMDGQEHLRSHDVPFCMPFGSRSGSSHWPACWPSWAPSGNPDVLRDWRELQVQFVFLAGLGGVGGGAGDGGGGADTLVVEHEFPTDGSETFVAPDAFIFLMNASASLSTLEVMLVAMSVSSPLLTSATVNVIFTS